jgi:sigma-B regulation protein RsbU (phosphoserine phosphatase)
MAAHVQRSMLPRSIPSVPGLDVACRMIPCDAVGGDYVDFLSGEDVAGRGFVAAVGDVAGHGPAAALLMTAARACLRMRASRPGSVGEVVSDLNRHLVADLSDVERFMTFYLIEVRSDAVIWVSAGHQPALLVDPGSGTVTELEGDGPPLGIDPDITFHEHHFPLRDSGEVLALYTDGITECWNPEGEQFGHERLKQSVLRHARQSASAILESVIRDVFDFRSGAPQRDDLTLVVLKRIP